MFAFLGMIQHKVELVEKYVRESGFSVTKLAQRMGKSRRWLYHIFEKPNVPMDYILEIGKIIHHDFSGEIKELKIYKESVTVQKMEDHDLKLISESEKAEYWKNKYLALLEKYNEALTRDK